MFLNFLRKCLLCMCIIYNTYSFKTSGIIYLWQKFKEPTCGPHEITEEPRSTQSCTDDNLQTRGAFIFDVTTRHSRGKGPVYLMRGRQRHVTIECSLIHVEGPGAGVTRILDDVTVRLTFSAWLSSALAHRPPAALSFIF